MSQFVDTPRLAERRRPFEVMEKKLVEVYLKDPSDDAKPLLNALRYALGMARLTAIRNEDGRDIYVEESLTEFSHYIRNALEARIVQCSSIWDLTSGLPPLLAKTRLMRSQLLENGEIHRDALEAEITTRKLAIVSGGGGGAGYVYPGCYEMIERSGLIPDLMVGTSMGALMSTMRARFKRFDAAPLLEGARSLSWTSVFRVLQTESHYGLPATLRLHLRDLLGTVFEHHSGRTFWLSDLEIPLLIVTTGITIEALRHDVEYYEHVLDDEAKTDSFPKSVVKVLAMFNEFLSSRDALREVVLGREPGTEDFDVLDAIGFSSAIPGILHYDVLREDPRMIKLLNALFARTRISRLGEGAMVSNVPARIAWETIVSGRHERRTPLVVALDCFAPTPKRLGWYPIQQLVRSANVEADLPFADIYIPMKRTLSPMNLVPTMQDTMEAIQWGREAMEPHLPLLCTLMAPIPVLKTHGPSSDRENLTES